MEDGWSGRASSCEVEAGGAHLSRLGARLQQGHRWVLGRGPHRNAFGLRRGRLRNMDFEHPRLIRRGDLVRVHGGAQGEAPAEGAERPFAVMRIAVLPVLDTVLDQAFLAASRYCSQR